MECPTCKSNLGKEQILSLDMMVLLKGVKKGFATRIDTSLIHYFRGTHFGSWFHGEEKPVIYVHQVVSLSREQLLSAKNLGKQCLDILEQRLSEHGLKLSEKQE